MEKALRIIEVVARSGGAITMPEIERATGLARPTTHRVTGDLIALGYVDRDEEQRRYSEGPRLVTLALDVLRASGPRTRRREVLAALARESGESCHFTLLSGSEVLLVDHVSAPVPLAVRYDGMTSLPAHCTASGRLLLSLLADSQRDAVLSQGLSRYSERTLVDRRKLLALLAEIRASRVGTEDGEHIAGVAGIAVPVQTGSGRLIGALGLSAPQARASLGQCMRHLPAMHAAADKLASQYMAGSRT